VARKAGWIVADTSAVLALLDADSAEHVRLVRLWERSPASWLIPSVVLPELDYLVRQQLSVKVARVFLNDLLAGAFIVEHSRADDLRRAVELDARYAKLNMGLVDCVVAAVAERLHAVAIATLDVRHFGALRLTTSPAIYPRDL
jgi:uncharacterized protein